MISMEMRYGVTIAVWNLPWSTYLLTIGTCNISDYAKTYGAHEQWWNAKRVKNRDLFFGTFIRKPQKKKDLFHDTFTRRKTIQDLFVDTSYARWCHCRKKFAFALDVLNLICICLGHAYVTSVFDFWIFCFWFSSCVSSFLFLPLPPPSSFFLFLLFFLPFPFSSGTCVFQASVLQPEWG